MLCLFVLCLYTSASVCLFFCRTSSCLSVNLIIDCHFYMAVFIVLFVVATLIVFVLFSLAGKYRTTIYFNCVRTAGRGRPVLEV